MWTSNTKTELGTEQKLNIDYIYVETPQLENNNNYKQLKSQPSKQARPIIIILHRNLHACCWTHACVFTHTHTCTCMHACTHTCTHAHTHRARKSTEDGRRGWGGGLENMLAVIVIWVLKMGLQSGFKYSGWLNISNYDE